MMRIIHFERLGREPGAEYATSRTIDLVMLAVIRFVLQSPDAGRAGLFLAMKDRRLVPALWLIHNEPARDWTVDMLAEAARMSRPRFSAHFKSIRHAAYGLPRALAHPACRSAPARHG